MLKDSMDVLLHGKGLVAVICLLLCGLGCSLIGAVAERQPDETLFERGIAAAEQEHFSVACNTFSILIPIPNTPTKRKQFAIRLRPAAMEPHLQTAKSRNIRGILSEIA